MTEPKPVQGPKGGIFGLGLIDDFQRDPLHFLMNVAHQYDDIIKWRFGPYDMYLVTHPEYVRELLVKKWDVTPKWERQARITEKMSGAAIGVVEGDAWKQRRKLLQPAFHTQRILDYLELMNRHTQQLIDVWQAEGDDVQRDILPHMTSATMGIIGEILFGIEDIENDAEEMTEALYTLVEMFMLESTALMPVPDWVPTPRNLRENHAMKYSKDFVEKLIEERRASGEDRGDVMSALILAADEDDGTTLSNTQVRDDLLGLFIAGHETTSLTMTWAFYLLAKHPEIQEQLYQEVTRVMAGGQPTLEDLREMSLTDRVIQETLRVYPAAWALFLRTAAEDIQLGESVVPAGSVVFMSPYVIHHDERWWPNPDTFDPSRFEGDWKASRPAYAYMAFGGGPRVCPGSHMAEMEAEVMLASLVKQFKFELIEPNQEVKPRPLFTLHPDGGMPLRVVQR